MKFLNISTVLDIIFYQVAHSGKTSTFNTAKCTSVCLEIRYSFLWGFDPVFDNFFYYSKHFIIFFPFID